MKSLSLLHFIFKIIVLLSSFLVIPILETFLLFYVSEVLWSLTGFLITTALKIALQAYIGLK